MKLCATRFATAVALAVIAKKLIHLAMFKLMPDFYMSLHPISGEMAKVAEFFGWPHFGVMIAHGAIEAFVVTWIAISLYNLMVKE